MRGELLYASTLLDEMRQHIILADDWLNDRTPRDAVHAKFHQRGSESVISALQLSLGPRSSAEFVNALRQLLPIYRGQIVELHAKFSLARPLANDLEALAVLGQD